MNSNNETARDFTSLQLVEILLLVPAADGLEEVEQGQVELGVVLRRAPGRLFALDPERLPSAGGLPSNLGFRSLHLNKIYKSI